MKKVLSLFLILVLCFGLSACKNSTASTVSKEEMLKTATVINSDEMNADIGGNKAKAQTYIGGIYLITGRVSEIEENYCIVRARKAVHTKMVYAHHDGWGEFDAEFELHVYLPLDELINVKSASDISFVGTVIDIGSRQDNYANILYLDIHNAYLVE